MTKSDLKRFQFAVAAWNAKLHMALYEKTGNGLFVWRAYKEYRKQKLPMPEQILVALDGFAARLEHASSARSVAEAVGMAVKRGGAAGASKARSIERQRDVVLHVSTLLRIGATPEEAYKSADSHFHRKSSKNTFLKWAREAKLFEARNREVPLESWRPVRTKTK